MCYDFRVIDGTNVTMSDEHMWLVPFIEGHNHTLKIEFKDRMLIAGLRVWNYNKSTEDTFRGVCIVVLVNVSFRILSWTMVT